MTWHGALCRANPELFFSDDSGAPYTEARAICARCPLQEPCLAYALEDLFEPVGVAIEAGEECTECPGVGPAEFSQ